MSTPTVATRSANSADPPRPDHPRAGRVAGLRRQPPGAGLRARGGAHWPGIRRLRPGARNAATAGRFLSPLADPATVDGWTTLFARVVPDRQPRCTRSKRPRRRVRHAAGARRDRCARLERPADIVGTTCPALYMLVPARQTPPGSPSASGTGARVRLRPDPTPGHAATSRGRNPHDKALIELVGELSTQSETFRQRWASQDVRYHRSGRTWLGHPAVGNPIWTSRLRR